LQHVHGRFVIVHGLIQRIAFLTRFGNFEGSDTSNRPNDAREPVVVGCCDCHTPSNEGVAQCGARDDQANEDRGEVCDSLP
jgi:hypothetical protein